MNQITIVFINSIAFSACFFVAIPAFSQNSNVYVDESRRQNEIQRGLNAIKDQRNSKTGSYGSATFSPAEKAALEAIFNPQKYEPPKKSDYEIAALMKAKTITQRIISEHKNNQFGYNNLLNELPLTFKTIKSVSNGTTNGVQSFKNDAIEINAPFRNGILEGIATIIYKNHPKISSINAVYVNDELNGKATVVYKNNYYENLVFVNGAAYGECNIYDKAGNKKLSFYRQNNLITGLVTEFYGNYDYAKFLYDNNELVTLLRARRDDLQYYYPIVEMWRGLNGNTPIYDGFLTKRFQSEEGSFHSVIQIDGDNTSLTGWSNGTSYIGKYKKGKRSGFGKWIWADGGIYIGDFKNDEFDGFGRLYYNSGVSYEGNFENGKFNGLGKMYFNDGEIYEGEYKNDLRHGKGKYTKQNGFYATGTFERGNNKNVKFYNNQNIEITQDVYNGKIENGFTKIVYNEKSFFAGELKNWQCSGKGYLRYDNGNQYEGDFLEDKLNGNGVYTYLDGAIYTGQFKNDVFEGKGKIVFADGNTYVGDFSNNNFNGKGTYTYADKSILVGDFVDGKATGSGKLTWPNGDYYIGEFNNFQLNGKAKIYYANGTLHFDGSYQDNVRKGPASVYFKDSKETATGVYGDYYAGEGLWEGEVVFTKPTGYKKTTRWYGQKWNDIKCFDPKGNPITESEYNKN